MIFVTVGHQLPFDRLVELVDRWAGERGRGDLFAQVGEGRYRPRHFACAAFLEAAEFERRMRECRAVVGHAGTGTIIRALTLGKPMLVLPRLARLGESVHDHQVGTAAHFAAAGQVLAAPDDAGFVDALDRVEAFRARAGLRDRASPELLAELEQFLQANA